MSAFDLLLAVQLAFGIAYVLLLRGILGVRPWTARRVTCSFSCPPRRQPVTAEFLQDPRNGGFVEVNWCTAFRPAAAITCEKQCLRLPSVVALLGRTEAA